MTPTHCRGRRGLANRITEPRIVKNLRVVVKMEQVRGPSSVIVVNINSYTKRPRGSGKRGNDKVTTNV